MYSEAFCRVYNEFGWNYFPEIFGEQLLLWMEKKELQVKKSMDLACGTGILCQILFDHGIEAAGMDFSEGMIAIARENNPEISYDVADMITYRPKKSFDLVTCTGDAINHIEDPENVRKIFENVYAYLEKGGWFVFDVLNKNEISSEEPFDLDWSETVKAKFQMLEDGKGHITLSIKVYENGVLNFEEQIHEVYHDPEMICALLKECGFIHVTCSGKLLDDSPYTATTWFVTAQKP